MKKMFISAIAVVAVFTAVAQENATKVKGKAKTESTAGVGESAIKVSQQAKTEAKGEATAAVIKPAAMEKTTTAVESAGAIATEAITDGTGRLSVGEHVSAAADHGMAVRAVATSPELSGANGNVVSGVAMVNALEASTKVGNIKLEVDVPDLSTEVKTRVRTNADIQVKPVNVKSNVHVKAGLGVKL